MRIEFDWDITKANANLAKHGIGFDSAMTIFRDSRALTIYDEDHGADEDRWITIGFASSGVLIVVVHTHMEVSRGIEVIRIISARRPTKREIRDYHEGSSS